MIPIEISHFPDKTDKQTLHLCMLPVMAKPSNSYVESTVFN